MASKSQVEPDEAPLSGAWSLTWTAPGAARDAAAVAALPLTWLPGLVPGTVAAALRAAAAGDGNGQTAPRPARLDAVDWWYRCTFAADPRGATDGGRSLLCFGGLATIADAWLNGEPLLHSENMFLAHAVDVTDRLREMNNLVLRFHALDPLLAARRPRPRWRAPMVEHQQLRWFRTTLLGRTPGWSPPTPPVGPWRPITLRRSDAALDFAIHDLQAALIDGTGVLTVDLELRPGLGRTLTRASLRVGARGALGASAQAVLDLAAGSDGSVRARGVARLGDAARWWPHTHGDQPLYDAEVTVVLDGEAHVVRLERIGFRSVRLDTRAGDFALSVNDVPVFCRGACWTPPDVVTLTGTADDYRRTLQAVKDAGMNMLRVGGTMVYESDLFYDLCDELGILVWQDFMFANMDYPEDAAFVDGVDGVRAEARQQLARWRGRPSLALLCGDSEGEQQAAMWGAPPASWQRPLFRETLPALCHELCPDVPYWPSSASGGAFPHQPNAGSTSYYGVGAYLRPLEDARRSEVRFASECLAFANVPEESVLVGLGGGGVAVRPPAPAWKVGVPRDLGAGWDFDDVRDHYLGVLYDVDPVELRSTDPERYLALGRVVTGEVMQSTFAEWRRARSTCRGGLIWLWRDLVAGAGWGLLDVTGRPKAAYHFVKRALAPRAVLFSDEGLNGATLHIVNEHGTPWRGLLRLTLYRDGEVSVGAGEMLVEAPPRGALELPASALLGTFTDTTYAYRFGPTGHDLAVARLTSPTGDVESEAFYFPVGRPSRQEAELGLEAAARPAAGGADFLLTVRSRRFAQAVSVNVDGFDPSDNHFHVGPGSLRTITLRRSGADGEPRGTVVALNARSSTRVAVTPGGAAGSAD